MKRIVPQVYAGSVVVPPSKSDAQRALLAAGMAKGQSLISNLGTSDDELVMLKFIQDIGAKVEQVSANVTRITGITTFPTTGDFFVGESGLSTRLITAMCAVHPGEYVVRGEKSILKRPLHFFEEIFPMFKAKAKTENGFLPVKITGPMQGTKAIIDGSVSSQYLTGLLMALPLAKEKSIIEVHHLVSHPYIEMTLNTLNKFGVKIEQDQLKYYHIGGNQQYKATDYSIGGDWSAASYWMVASALGMNIGCKGLSTMSYQADRAILTALETANCEVHHTTDGIEIDGTKRKAFDFDATHCPDLFPALVTFASLCEGKTSIKGLKRLSYKESNRGIALQQEFGKLGVKIELDADYVYVHGKTTISGGEVFSHGDHRIAMCLGIAGMFAESDVIIEDATVVTKSYPTFWDDLEGLIVSK